MEPREGEPFLDFAARCALGYDTSMSRAMLRALGVPAREPRRFGVVARVDAYEGVGECMGQRFGVRL